MKKVGRWGGLKEVETNRHRAGLFLVFGLNKHTEHINSKRVVQILSLEMPPHPETPVQGSLTITEVVGAERRASTITIIFVSALQQRWRCWRGEGEQDGAVDPSIHQGEALPIIL